MTSQLPRCLAPFLFVLSVATSLFAQSAPMADANARLAAEALFQQGKALMLEERFAEACPKLAESHRLTPTIGVLLHLGACMEALGRPASAWVAFREAGDRALAGGDTERESLARSRERELIPRLAYLTVRVNDVNLTPEQRARLEILRDGSLLTAGSAGVPIPCDPGKHTIVVRTPGMVPQERQLAIVEGQTTDIEITLEHARVTPAPKAVSPRPKASPPQPKALPPRPPAVPTPSRTGSLRRTLGWTSLGVGAAALTIAGIATAVSASQMSDAHSLCDDKAGTCSSRAYILQDKARTYADIGTGALIGGLLGLATGGGLLLLHRGEW